MGVAALEAAAIACKGTYPVEVYDGNVAGTVAYHYTFSPTT